ncbi:hypothetical protein LSTR_LSTR016283 [Laodelphax striatellus]|uniref:Uncharacterized protein n=1 Tax=Laodelphax striatellus TaxID=195883 RepID=A0A482XGJ6_LAOST|nr:hypothetical protein LSTR_LSTR016283 [Laodelphax striatellus]
MLEMMNGPKEFIDKMEAETRKGPVVVSTRSRQQERQPDGTKTPGIVEDVTIDRKLQGRHVVKIRVNAVGSTEGVAGDGLQSASNNATCGWKNTERCGDTKKRWRRYRGEEG